ncbi:uncharacterized protein LOC106874140 isoform X4 [Octopus bimaculoides]|uniref:uncharacterized protein LOC106874140 isoform X4 n=1 Tax=Octopus bimaculoides TaxID=37653 RepID=UPI0022E707EB|nr:uncharacterized protein LOC106874140 isoform X4 [Octopus bimaculoides]
MAPKYVDMRSDTFSKPSQAMREAMANADVGETMVLVMAHCQERGLEVIMGDKSHIYLFEQGHVAQNDTLRSFFMSTTGLHGIVMNLFSKLAGIFPRSVPTLKDGTHDLTTLAETISSGGIGDCRTKVICLENTHNRCGGKILPLDYLQELYNLAQENDIKVHVDGARILNASVGLGVPVSDITKFCDSLTCCLNKGIGAPFGSIVAGTESFIKRVERSRKALGGEMSQLGMEAAAALYGLDRFEESIQKDHFLAKKLVNGLKNLSSSVVTIEPEEDQTNLVLIKIDKEMSFITNLKKRLMTTTEAEVKELGKEIHVGCKLLGKDIRFAICCNINEEDIDDAIKKVCYVFNEIHF